MKQEVLEKAITLHNKIKLIDSFLCDEKHCYEVKLQHRDRGYCSIEYFLPDIHDYVFEYLASKKQELEKELENL